MYLNENTIRFVIERSVNLDLRPRVGVYSNENSPFAIKRPVRTLISLDFLLGVFSRGYDIASFTGMASPEEKKTKLHAFNVSFFM